MISEYKNIYSVSEVSSRTDVLMISIWTVYLDKTIKIYL